MHYLITSTNYQEFVTLKDQLESISEVDDISDICGSQQHPWYAWITHRVANIARAEVVFLLVLYLLTLLLSSLFDWSFAIGFSFFTLMTLFSVWVSGLVGWHMIHLYSQCQLLTKDKPHPLAILVDIDNEKQKKMEQILAKKNSFSVNQIKE